MAFIVQAVLFDNKLWTPTTARQWLKQHNYKPIKSVDKTANLLRYRIKEPTYKKYVTHKIGNNIELLLAM